MKRQAYVQPVARTTPLFEDQGAPVGNGLLWLLVAPFLLGLAGTLLLGSGTWLRYLAQGNG